MLTNDSLVTACARLIGATIATDDDRAAAMVVMELMSEPFFCADVGTVEEWLGGDEDLTRRTVIGLAAARIVRMLDSFTVSLTDTYIELGDRDGGNELHTALRDWRRAHRPGDEDL